MKGDRLSQLELTLRAHPEGLRKAELARRIGVHRSTIARYIDELGKYHNVYEEDHLVKIAAEVQDALALSVYETLALNDGAEILLKTQQFQVPYLASGLRKLGMSMQPYAPEIAHNFIQLADSMDEQKNYVEPTGRDLILKVLKDAWVIGAYVRIYHLENGNEEETEVIPLFLGYTETPQGRIPSLLVGRLRHTSRAVAIDYSKITNAIILPGTYTIADNMRVFKQPESYTDISTIDTITLKLKVKKKSALNGILILSKEKTTTFEPCSEGGFICTVTVEHSIRLFLRIVQVIDDIEILEPKNIRENFVNNLEKIIAIYKK